MPRFDRFQHVSPYTFSPGFVPTNLPQCEWMTTEEAAQLLRVHKTTVHQMARRGELPAIKTGKDWRISRKGLLEKSTLGDVHNKLIRETSAMSAEQATRRILECLAEALNNELSILRTDREVQK